MFDDNKEFILLQIIISSHRYSWEDDFILKLYANPWKSIIGKELREANCDWEKILFKIPVLTKYTYIFDYEWEVHEYVKGRKTTIGKGDLVFTDGGDNYLIVELKYLDLYEPGKTARTNRTNKRNKNLKQQRNIWNYFKVSREMQRQFWG